jgi:hypothetical protein
MIRDSVVPASHVAGIANKIQNVHRELQGMHSQLGGLNGGVTALEAKTNTVQLQLMSLTSDFERFVQQDAAHKELQLSETRLVRVRQDIESNFGHHADVRRSATGILQAADLAIVRQETLRASSEELMIRTPNYWLAPALVALSAWISDKRELAEKALAEAMRRDDAKTSLLMTLVCRRLGRHESARNWLTRYFSLQDPFKLDREAVVLLDALASGIFGAAGKSQSLAGIDDWLAEIRNRIGVLDVERKRWNEAFVAMTPAVANADYPTLAKYSETWPELRKALGAARRNARVRDNIAQIFNGEIVPSPKLVARVDGLIERLVTSFDDEELPLRSEMRRLELIVEANGDRKAADARYATEMEAFAAQTNFMSLLTSAARGIGVGETSRATQRLAFALSIPWMLEAYDDVVAASRAQVPVTIALAIDDWSGSTTAGANEAELVESVEQHVSEQERAEIAKLGGLKFWWPSIVAAVLLAASYYGGRGVILFAALFLAAQAVLYALRAPKIAAIRKSYAQQRAGRASTVRSFCVEVVDLREEIVREDAVSGEVRERLQSISAQDYLGSSNATGRTVLV